MQQLAVNARAKATTAPLFNPIARWTIEDAAYITHFLPLTNETFVLGYHDGTIKLVNNHFLKKLPATHSRILSLLALRNGQFMSTHTDGMCNVWDSGTGNLLTDVVLGKILSLVELDNGSLAMGSQDKHILLYDPIKQKVFDYIGTPASKNSDLLHLFPNGQLLSGRRDVGMFCFWNLATKKRIKLFRTQTDLTIMTLLNNKKLATSHRDGKIYLWNLANEGCEATLSNSSLIHSMTALSDNQLVTGDANGDIKIWDCAIQQTIGKFSLTDQTVESLHPPYINHLTAITHNQFAYVTNNEIGVLEFTTC